MYSKPVESFCVSIIIINAIFLGFQSDFAVKNPFEEDPPIIEFGQLGFFVFFWTELAARIAVDPLYFFQGKDWRWNYFDLFLMIAGTAQKITKSKAAGATLLRVLRAGRIMRIAPAIKTHPFFRELRLMIYSLISSLRGLFWGFLLMVSINYLFAMLFLGEATNYLRSNLGDGETVDALNEYWGSMAVALRSLFAAISGGDDWMGIAQPLFDISLPHGCLFVVYIFVVFAGLLNIMNGVFVDAALASSRADSDLVAQLDHEALVETIKSAKAVFESIGESLTEQQFQELLGKADVKGFFRSLDMDVEEAKCFFSILDTDNSGTLELDEFIQGCLRLQGAAKKIHVASLLAEHDRIWKAQVQYFNQLAQKVHNEFARLDKALNGTTLGELGRGKDAQPQPSLRHVHGGLAEMPQHLAFDQPHLWPNGSPRQNGAIVHGSWVGTPAGLLPASPRSVDDTGMMRESPTHPGHYWIQNSCQSSV
jgi:Ca2+-binding EF-hand superfamily protein